MNTLRSFTVLIAAFGGMSVAQAAPVSGQIYEFDGHYYSWINSYISWDEAVTYAENYSGEISGITLDEWHLATITSAEENEFIWNTVLKGDDSLGQVWLGGIVTDGSVGNFEWITGELFTYRTFAPGNPSHARETVLEMAGGFGPQWNDEDREFVHASVAQSFLIEHSSVIKPVAIDVKPGGEPTCGGAVPVAILGSDTLDVTQVDPATLSYEGLDVRQRENASLKCRVEDVNRDGYDDFLCQYQDTTTTGLLTGALLDGTPIEGYDTICVVN